MEGLSNRVRNSLNKYTVVTLKEIIRQLKLPNYKSKGEMINAIQMFVVDPQRRQYIFSNLSKEIFLDLELPDPSLNCICDNTDSRELIICTNCHQKQHSSCMICFLYLEVYECIICQMKKINPSDEILEFLVSPYMISSNPLKPTTKFFEFSEVLQKDIYSGPKNLEIQLRCLKLENPGYNFAWPRQGQLKLNGAVVRVFNEPKNIKKRRDHALDVSVMLKIGLNEVSLMKMNDLSNYCFAVAKIHKNSKPELFAKLYKNFFNKDQSLEFFRSKFLNEKDIKSSSIKINLKCPYTFKLIKYPARGKDCSHIKFFDLDTFIDVQAYENYS